MSTIFITGSSSGIGKATAKCFAENGWHVIATMRTPEKETELTAYDNIEIYPLDVTKPEQVKDTIQKVLSKEDVDVLFNNVGYGMKARFEDIPEDKIYHSFEANLLGMIRVTQEFIPYFKKKKGGTILTTTSLAGIIGLPLDGVYAADKWGLEGLSEMLYFELMPFNIQVKTLVPGVVKTNFKVDQIPYEGDENVPKNQAKPTGGPMMATFAGYEDMIRNQIQLLLPDMNDIEEAEEAARDAYEAVTDGNKDRMCYVTGKVAKELYDKRQELGDEKFRQYMRNILMPGM